MSKRISWLDHAIDNPTSLYAAPADVLRDERLDKARRRAVLEAWVAGQTAQLQEAQAALAELDRVT
jgi:hypothetical protein